MKFLKWLLIIVVGIIILIFIVSAFLPSQKVFSTSVVINASPRHAYTLVNNFKNWEKWSPFHEMDTAMVSEYSGPDFGVGAFYKWTSKVNGNGSMTIVESIYDQKVTYLLDFGMGSKDSSWFYMERVPDGTKVTWETKIVKTGYPMGRLMWAFFGGMMDQTFKRGLDRLKIYIESLPADCKTTEVAEATIPAKLYLTYSETVKSEEIANFLGKAYGLILQNLQASNLKMAGPPSAFYNGDPWTPTWVITAAIEVSKEPKKIDSNLATKKTTEQKVVWVSHLGDYSTSPDAYYKLEDYMKEKGLTPAGEPWEEYITDPTTVADPLQIETKIYFPVK